MITDWFVYQFNGKLKTFLIFMLVIETLWFTDEDQSYSLIPMGYIQFQITKRCIKYLQITILVIWVTSYIAYITINNISK